MRRQGRVCRVVFERAKRVVHRRLFLCVGFSANGHFRVDCLGASPGKVRLWSPTNTDRRRRRLCDACTCTYTCAARHETPVQTTRSFWEHGLVWQSCVPCDGRVRQCQWWKRRIRCTMPEPELAHPSNGMGSGARHGRCAIQRGGSAHVGHAFDGPLQRKRPGLVLPGVPHRGLPTRRCKIRRHASQGTETSRVHWECDPVPMPVDVLPYSDPSSDSWEARKRFDGADKWMGV